MHCQRLDDAQYVGPEEKRTISRSANTYSNQTGGITDSVLEPSAISENIEVKAMSTGEQVTTMCSKQVKGNL